MRDFYIHNTLYWLEEYHFDGLRFDAVHAIIDDSEPNIMTEIARAAHNGPGRERDLFLVLENGANHARFLGRARAHAIPSTRSGTTTFTTACTRC